MARNILHLFVMLCTIFIYFRLLNHGEINIIKRITLITAATLIAAVMYLLPPMVLQFKFIILLLILSTGAILLTNDKLVTAVTTTIISMGISYGLSLVALVLAFYIGKFSMFDIDDNASYLIASVLQIVLTLSLMGIRRFRNGFIFLKSKWWSNGGGLIISGFILALLFLVGNENIDYFTTTLLIVSTLVLSVALIIWGFVKLTKQYRTWQKERNKKEDQETIQKLTLNNEQLSKELHRNFKTLRSMYYALSEFLATAGYTFDAEKYTHGQRLLADLDLLLRERSGLALKRQREFSLLPSSDCEMIDALLRYMMNRASDNNIQFDVSADLLLNEIIEQKFLTASRLETLLADLIENAIIATSTTDYRLIKLSTSISGGVYDISISDSGMPFQIKTLMNLGLERSSTHFDAGGSGIGYMTIFEILQEIKASLIITEFEPRAFAFTKKIIVRFDSRREYIIESYRADEIMTAGNRQEMIVRELETQPTL